MLASSDADLSPTLSELETYLCVDDFEKNVALGVGGGTKIVASVLQRKGESLELVYQSCQ
jgi:hypothetical protein